MGVFSVNFPGTPTIMRINSPNMTPTVPGNYKNNYGASSFHPGGALFCMGDQSVRFLSNNVDFYTYNLLGGRADGLTVTPTTVIHAVRMLSQPENSEDFRTMFTSAGRSFSMMRTWSWLAVALFSLTLAGCGDKGDPNTDEGSRHG